jgi:predicted phage baseplate assembly protein
LLDSGATDAHFVAEIEDDGTARLRFGDNRLGARPHALSDFDGVYRIGNGAAGNVGAESIAHLYTHDAALRAETRLVRNPLPARGGVEPETLSEVRAYAPAAFRTQERAVTEADYAAVTERHAGVQRAIATFHWTGSWHTVFITVDRLGEAPMDDDFEESIRRHVERYRMAGHDLEIDGPRYVSLEIEMHVCAEPDYFRADVQAALLQLFSNRVLPDGRLGAFHPDQFTFGQTVYLSPLIAAAQAVPGVMSVQVKRFQRQGTPDNKPLSAGKLDLGRLEIARCDNDPNFAEHGVFHLSVGGGK